MDDSFGYSATIQTIDISLAQSVEIDPVSTSMSCNAESEMQANKIFEIDAIPSSMPHGSDHRRTGTFGLGGAVTFLPEKFTQFPNA